MSEKSDKKVINFFGKQKSEKGRKGSKVKTFEGFGYVKTDRDSNGNPFVKSTLLEYAEECNYMITVMRESSEGKITLNNYGVPQDRLYEFVNAIETGKYDGTIIEIEKYISEDLA